MRVTGFHHSSFAHRRPLMPRPALINGTRTWKSAQTKFIDPFEEIAMFFQGKDPVHQTMRRLVKRLERANIPYAVVGGMAVFIQGYRRTTDDLDILVTRQGL